MNARKAKEIFIANFELLPEEVKQAVEFTLANWHELNLEEAQAFLQYFGALPRNPKETDKVTCVRLSVAINTFKKSPEIWLSLEDLPQEYLQTLYFPTSSLWRKCIG